LRSLCRDIAELRRADHGGRKLQLEQDRIEEQREKTEAEVVAKFEHWAKIPAVQDWLCQTWVPIEERLRRKRELFELPPEAGGDDAEADQESDKDDVEAEGEAPGSSPVKPGQGSFSKGPAKQSPSAPDATDEAASPAVGRPGGA